MTSAAMEANHEEVEALLRELEGVGGFFSADASEQARPFSQRQHGSGNVDTAVRLYTKDTPKPSGRTLFSTYAPDTSSNDACRASIPLGERLPPLKPLGRQLHTFHPSASTTPIDAALNGTSPMKRPVRGVLSQRVSLSEARQTAALLSGGSGLTEGTRATQTDSRPAPEEEDTPTPTDGVGMGWQEANFLPLMCARYMSPAGIAPRASWGHTLTPIRGDKLLLFGGTMAETSTDSATLFEYDTHHVAWDPVFVASGTPPTPRTYHAACAYEGRWLYISGGMSEGGSRILGDLHCYDTQTQEWSCVWRYSSASAGGNRNEPTPRFGHSMLIREDRLYIFGGRTMRREQDENATRDQTPVTLANVDVYVFSLSSQRWRRRIHAGRQTMGPDTKSKEETQGDASTPNEMAKVTRPAPRYHHAAAILGDKLFINGGLDERTTLSDTWVLDLKESKWEMLHDGSSADAFPRDRHHLFACGEAILVVGGCSPSIHAGRIAMKYHNFVAVLPLVGDVARCWIPVAMGNVAVVAPNKKSFGAAFSGGFVHVFGGVCGTEVATNTMVRFLAADGYATGDLPSDVEAVRLMMRGMRETGTTIFDTYALPRAWDGNEVVDLTSCRPFGMHRALVQQRAPKFWEDLSRCRSETVRPAVAAANARLGLASVSAELGLTDANPGGYEGVKEREHGDGIHPSSRTPQTTMVAAAGASSSSVTSGLIQKTAYYTEGNSRVQGLTVPLTSDQLRCLLDYIYWGGLHHRALLVEEDGGEEADAANPNEHHAQRQETQRMMQALLRAAEAYALSPLAELCEAVLQRSRKRLRHAQEHSVRQLRSDLHALLETGAGATMTVLFLDPHTKQNVAHPLHPFILVAASSFFADLLRPLLSGQRTSFQLGPVAAKLTTASRGASHTRRSILVGPLSVPSLAVTPLLRYLYTQHLTTPREAAFATMLGSHLLDVGPLQAYCESILAREEVNYDTAAEFYSLSGKYRAALLQEVSLLTAVLGFAEVRHSVGFKALSAKESREIEAVANELGAAAWIAPPQPVSEIKPAEVYQSRWNASSA